MTGQLVSHGPYKRFQVRKFLVKNSHNSMASIHCKIKPHGEYQIRIADCNRTVKLWGNLDNLEDCKEAVEKIETLVETLELFKEKLLKQMPFKHAKTFYLKNE